jgi:hypothetical protein
MITVGTVTERYLMCNSCLSRKEGTELIKISIGTTHTATTRLCKPCAGDLSIKLIQRVLEEEIKDEA